MALTGLGQAALETLLEADTQGYRAIPIEAVEKIIGKPVTLEIWDKATLKLSHQGMTR